MEVEYDEDNVWLAAGEGAIERTFDFITRVHGNNVNCADEHGYTPLMAACSYGQVDLVRELLARGADANQRDGDGNTAVHHCDYCDCLNLLYARGADLSLKNSDGQTALEVKQGELEEGVVVDEDREGEEAEMDGELSRLVARLLELSVEQDLARAGDGSKRVKPIVLVEGVEEL